MSSKIQVVIKRAGCKPTIELIDPSLKVVREIIGGDLEIAIHIFGRALKIACYCNEDGKRLQLRPNFLHPSLHDVIVGDVVWIAEDASGNEASIPDEIATKIVELMAKWSPADDREELAS